MSGGCPLPGWGAVEKVASPSSLMQAYQACKPSSLNSCPGPRLSAPTTCGAHDALGLWQTSQPTTWPKKTMQPTLLGLIDDLQHCLVNKMCPNCFSLSAVLEHLSEETVMLHARKLSSGRSGPAEHLRCHRARQGSKPAGWSSEARSTTSIPLPAVRWRRSQPARWPSGQKTAAASDWESRKVHLCLH